VPVTVPLESVYVPARGRIIDDGVILPLSFRDNAVSLVRSETLSRVRLVLQSRCINIPVPRIRLRACERERERERGESNSDFREYRGANFRRSTISRRRNARVHLPQAILPRREGRTSPLL